MIIYPINVGALTTAVAPVVAATNAFFSLMGLSTMSATGASKIVDIMDSTAKRFGAFMFSPFGWFMESFEKIFLAVNAKLLVIAEQKPSQVNDTSETDAKMTPKTTGSSEAYTGNGKKDLRNIAEPTTLTNGSIAFTTCVNDTATAPRDTTVATCPTVCPMEIGRSVFTAEFGTTGFLRIPNIHCGNTYITPMSSWIQDTNHGTGNQFKTRLFEMLYTILKAYHRKIYEPTFKVCANDFLSEVTPFSGTGADDAGAPETELARTKNRRGVVTIQGFLAVTKVALLVDIDIDEDRSDELRDDNDVDVVTGAAKANLVLFVIVMMYMVYL